MRASLPVLLAVLCAASPARAAFLADVHLPDRQPDGTPVDLWVTGDEHHRRVCDARGFTVVKDPRTGWRVYADLREGRLVPTRWAAGVDDPVAAGLAPGLDAPDPRALPLRPAPTRAAPPPAKKVAGVATNLMIFVRFQDDKAPTDVFEDYRKAFVSEDPKDPSLLRYFREVSRGALDVNTVFLPAAEGTLVAYHTVAHPRGFVRDYDPVGNPDGYRDAGEGQAREQVLWTEVLEEIAATLPPGTDLDGNDDGWVDNAIFMVQGEPDQWADVLWPHAWALWVAVELGGAKVESFNLQFTSMTFQEPGVFAHEMYHSLGAPDLYHYNYDGRTPVGPWDLMERTAKVPQHPLAYMKWRYGGWVDDLPWVSANGPVVLHDSWDDGPQAVRVRVPESTGEYFVLEYRRAAGSFESGLPGSGLIVYRVNGDVAGDGNRAGPPDEIRVMRPDSPLQPDGDLEAAFLSAEEGRTILNQRSPIRAVLEDGSGVTLRVFDVGYPGDTLTFQVCLQPPDGCGGRTCDDGCGGWCGDCPNGRQCVDGACVACSCAGKACGDNGCGTSCGTCPSDPCAQQRCEYGACVAIFRGDDGTPCEDGGLCTKGDTCQGGVCRGQAYTCTPGPCDATATCDGEGGCTRVPVAAGSDCSDGDPCTTGDTCGADGTCGGQAFTCTPGPCEATSSCDSHGGCYVTWKAQGTACDDGDGATVDDRCDAKGRCVGTVPQATDDTGAPAKGGGKSGGCRGGSGGPGAGAVPGMLAALLALGQALRRNRKTR